MSYHDKLNPIKSILTSIPNLTVGHYTVSKKTDKYCVWAETGEPEFIYGDNFKLEYGLEGYIDYFTKMEDDPNVDAIVDGLTAGGISFNLNSVQYEDDTEFIHYEWIWQI